jgi:pimeloyl-ACP methyl ester carboxylesterase
VGSSLGAAIAEELSFRRPDLAKGLVLVDGGLPTPPAGGGGLAANLLPGLGERRYRAFRGRPEAAYASLEPYYADISALGAEDRVFLAERVVERVESESQLRAYFSLFRSLVGLALFGRSRQKRLLAASPTPLLILWGREDSIIPCEGALFLAGIAPRARVAILDHCGHLPHQEAPEAVAREILDFARSQVL